MAAGPTNIFNANSGLTQSMQLKLVTMALAGDSPVSNGITEMADRNSPSPKGRERKERDQAREFAERMRASQERMDKFQEKLNQLEQATAQALQENAEKLRESKKALDDVRARAYEITNPDGSTKRVYRDGDKVRDEAGAEVSSDVVQSDDLGDKFSNWSEFVKADLAHGDIKAEHDRIKAYQMEVGQARGRGNEGDLSDKELDDLEARMKKDMPSSIREHMGSIQPGVEVLPPESPPPDGDHNEVRVMQQRPAASAPAPR